MQVTKHPTLHYVEAIDQNRSLNSILDTFITSSSNHNDSSVHNDITTTNTTTTTTTTTTNTEQPSSQPEKSYVMNNITPYNIITSFIYNTFKKINHFFFLIK